MMQRLPVESSNLADIGYDADTQVAEVTFKSGKRYRYHGVPPEVFANFMGAESPGGFFAREIRGQYETVPVDV